MANKLSVLLIGAAFSLIACQSDSAPEPIDPMRPVEATAEMPGFGFRMLDPESDYGYYVDLVNSSDRPAKFTVEKSYHNSDLGRPTQVVCLAPGETARVGGYPHDNMITSLGQELRAEIEDYAVVGRYYVEDCYPSRLQDH